MSAISVLSSEAGSKTVFADNIVDARPQIDVPFSLSDLSLEVDAQSQASLDRVLDHINQAALMPQFEVTGDLISLTLSLHERLSDILPDTLAEDGKVVMSLLTNALCDYAEETGFTGFSLMMEFRK